MALDQRAVAGIGKGAGGGWQGNAGSPSTLELGVTGCGRGVVRRGWGWQGRVEAGYTFHVCEHAVHGRTAVYTATTHLAQGQNWTLVSEPFVWKELIRVLNKKETKVTNLKINIFLGSCLFSLAMVTYPKYHHKVTQVFQ